MSPQPPTSPRNRTLESPERELAALFRRDPAIVVLTGGQTGVDTAAAAAALRVGLRVHVVFPRGLRQEDGRITAARRRALRGATMHELDSDDFAYRTWTCAYLADAVILIDPAGGDGCQETVRAARTLGKPLLSLATPRKPSGSQPTPESGDVRAAVCSFLSDNEARVLMVAGCRASLLAAAGSGQLADELVTLVAAATRERSDALPR